MTIRISHVNYSIRYHHFYVYKFLVWGGGADTRQSYHYIDMHTQINYHNLSACYACAGD